jgi:hypothetical protein
VARVVGSRVNGLVVSSGVGVRVGWSVAILDGLGFADGEVGLKRVWARAWVALRPAVYAERTVELALTVVEELRPRLVVGLVVVSGRSRRGNAGKVSCQKRLYAAQAEATRQFRASRDPATVFFVMESRLWSKLGSGTVRS